MEIQENMGHNHKQFSFIEITTKILDTHTFRLWKDFQGVCEWWYMATDTQAHTEETRENSGDYKEMEWARPVKCWKPLGIFERKRNTQTGTPIYIWHIPFFE